MMAVVRKATRSDTQRPPLRVRAELLAAATTAQLSSVDDLDADINRRRAAQRAAPLHPPGCTPCDRKRFQKDPERAEAMLERAAQQGNVDGMVGPVRASSRIALTWSRVIQSPLALKRRSRSGFGIISSNTAFSSAFAARRASHCDVLALELDESSLGVGAAPVHRGRLRDGGGEDRVLPWLVESQGKRRA